MTVCVGALSSNSVGHKSRAVIVASDRMVTMGQITEFEPETPKIARVTDKVVALTAGDALKGADLLQRLRAGIASDSTVRSIAENAAAIYAQLRAEQLQAEVFSPRGISMQAFYQGLQTQMIHPLAASMDNTVMQFNFGLEMLIAGTDDEGAHLFAIGNPGGQVYDLSAIGFHAIGSGAIHAVHSMIGFRHTGGRPLEDTIFDVYLSKKRGEAAPGVGKDTDLVVLTEKGQKWLTGDDLEKLDKLVEEYQNPADTEVAAKLKGLNLLGENSADSGAKA